MQTQYYNPQPTNQQAGSSRSQAKAFVKDVGRAILPDSMLDRYRNKRDRMNDFLERPAYQQPQQLITFVSQPPLQQHHTTRRHDQPPNVRPSQAPIHPHNSRPARGRPAAGGYSSQWPANKRSRQPPQQQIQPLPVFRNTAIRPAVPGIAAGTGASGGSRSKPAKTPKRTARIPVVVDCNIFSRLSF